MILWRMLVLSSKNVITETMANTGAVYGVWAFNFSRVFGDFSDWFVGVAQGSFLALSCSDMRVFGVLVFEFSRTHTFCFIHRETCFAVFR